MNSPVSRDRPQMPDGYGTPDDDDTLLAWSTVNERLTSALHYWMATVRPNGRPHVVPRWGAWIDNALYYDGSPETVHARNLTANPACTLHIGDGAEAIILEGKAAACEPVSDQPGGLGEQVAAEIGRKYAAHGYEPAADSWSGPDAGGLIIFRPHKAMAWLGFPTDLTRFHFQ